MLHYNKKEKMNHFERVLISSIYKRNTRIEIFEENEYKLQVKKSDKLGCGGICEIVGLKEFQVKPYFDIDAKIDLDKSFDETIIDDIENDIKKICNVEIYKSKRPSREDNEKMKYSYRLYLEARISYDNIPVLFKNVFDKYDIIDNSVYNPNRILFTPMNKIKKDNVVPELTNIKGTIFDNCATYIKEEYIDLDLEIEKPKEEPKEIKFNNDLCDNTEITYDGKLNFNEIITKLSKERASNYNDWFYIGVALINLYYRKIISRGQIYDLFDLFSAKAENYDADSVIKVIDININRFDGKGYGIKYLLDCLKIDDIEYYKSITEKDNIIDSADDDEGAANIVVKYYNDKLLICEKNLYVYNNHIWNGDEKEVNKLLCNMITDLKIKFVGADNKRKYSYSSSVKHQKNCIIAIKNNSNIKINNNFINDLSFNNKYYLPFLNGVYSFKDKKLYEYEALSNIYFTHIINRDFMPKDDEAYNELMTQVINPIYPIESEKKYNAEIKARAIAGCVQDKIYYLQTGERNSGKGVETDLMKKAFDKYVKSFDTSTLIYNKFKVNDAKALSWLVDKRFARILIGNEIDTFDDDDENKRKKEPILMNSKLIKQLVSGGDEIEARQNYKDEIQFKVGFTLFINSNDTFEFTTKDAGENLITLQYKSKFVKKDELIDGCEYYKLKDDNIKNLTNEDRIVNAYIHYIIDNFNDYVPIVPEEIKLSTEINNKAPEITVEQFIFKNFKNTDDKNNKLHIETLRDILAEHGFDVGNKITTLFTKLQIGIHNKNITIDKIKKQGFSNIIYSKSTE